MSGPAPLFAWSGKNANGLKVQGECEARDEPALQRMLYSQGIVLSSAKKVRPATQPLLQRKIPAADITVFLRQCASLLAAGLPLVQSLEICIDSTRLDTLRTELGRIREHLDAGTGFSAALRGSRLADDHVLVNLIHAGEQSGTLDTMMERLASDSEKACLLRARVKKALTYPLAVLLVAVVVTTLLLIKVVPQFAKTFTDLGAELPALTRMVMTLSELAAIHAAGATILMAVVVITGTMSMRQFVIARWYRDRLLCRLPVIGEIVRHACVARICRILGSSIGAGLPLVQALQSSACAAGNLVYERACLELSELVNQGQTLGFGVRKAQCFPVMMGQLIHAGEQSGTLEQMLENCAIRFEQSVDQSVDKLSSLIEPVIMSVLGVVIATLLLAMYLPVFRLGAVL